MEKVICFVSFVFRVPESVNVGPLTGLTVCGDAPLLVNVMTPPALIVTLAGVNEKSLISTLAASGALLAVAVGLGLGEPAVVAVALGLGPVPVEAVGEALGDEEGDAMGDAVGLAVAFAVAVTAGEAVSCAAGVADALGLAVALTAGAVPVLGQPVSINMPTANQNPGEPTGVRISPSPAFRCDAVALLVLVAAVPWCNTPV